MRLFVASGSLILIGAIIAGCGGDQAAPTGMNPITPSAVGTASTTILYGVDSGVDALYTVDPATGFSTPVGPLDPDVNLIITPVCMAIEPSSYAIYVWNNSDPNGILLVVDPCTGLAAPADGVGTPRGTSMQGLAFHPDGRLFGVDNNLFSIDPATGIPTNIGPLGFRAGAADFDAAGTLYVVELDGAGTEVLGTVNLATGAATVIGTLSMDIGVIGSIVFDPVTGTLIGSSIDNLLFDIDTGTAAVSNFRLGPGAQGLGFAPQCGEIMIDIKPDSVINPINLKSKGVIPVAILGSATFDVSTVDCSTIAFGPYGAEPAHLVGCHPEYVNADNYMDLIVHFRTQETGLAMGDIEACLTAETLEGVVLDGCDQVAILPPGADMPRLIEQ